MIGALAARHAAATTRLAGTRGLLDSLGWASLAVLVAAWTVTVLAAPLLPLQDVADWTYQGWLLERLIAGDPRVPVEIKPYPVPNTLVTVIAAGLVPLVGADEAGRFLGVLALGSVAAGCAAFAHAARAGGWAAAMLFAIVGLSTPFLLGYVAFTLGMGLLALALANERAERLGVRAVIGWSLLLFFTHAIPFLVFALVIAWHHVAVLRSKRSAAALLPALVLALWYAGARLLGDESTAATAPDIEPGWGAMLWEQLRWKPFTAAAAGPWREMRVGDAPLITLDPLAVHWLLAFNLLFTAALAAGVAHALRRRVARGQLAAVDLLPPALLVALFVVAPPIDFFGMINAGERFWLAACLLLVPLVRPRPVLLAALVLASLPVQAINLLAVWRIDAPLAREVAHDTPWHPFILPLGARLEQLARVADDDPRPIDPGYETGLLRNR